jgi:hypothetical protein
MGWRRSDSAHPSRAWWMRTRAVGRHQFGAGPHNASAGAADWRAGCSDNVHSDNGSEVTPVVGAGLVSGLEDRSGPHPVGPSDAEYPRGNLQRSDARREPQRELGVCSAMCGVPYQPGVKSTTARGLTAHGLPLRDIYATLLWLLDWNWCCNTAWRDYW